MSRAYLEESICRAVLGEQLLSPSPSYSFKAAEDFAEWRDEVIRRDAAALSRVINEQVLIPLIIQNWPIKPLPILPIDDDHEAVTTANAVLALEWNPPLYWNGYEPGWESRVVLSRAPACPS